MRDWLDGIGSLVRRHRLAAAGIGVAILAVAGVAYALTRDPGPQEEIVYRYGTVEIGRAHV